MYRKNLWVSGSVTVRSIFAQMECFCAVARTGSFTKAAAELALAQPSLSEQISKLEQALNCALFERLNRRVELTPLGEALLPKARAVLEDAAALPRHLEAAREGVDGLLRVGAIPTILPYFLTPSLRGFVDRYPRVDLHLREATTDQLLKQLQDGVLDIAIVSVPVQGAGLVVRELFCEPLYLAVPQDQTLASASKVRLRRVSHERLLILKDGHCLRDETLTICNRGSAGFGVSIIPEMARRAAEGCRLIPIDPKAARRVGYVKLQRRYVSKTMEAFTAFLRETCAAVHKSPAHSLRTPAAIPTAPAAEPRTRSAPYRRN